jgi:hypothetical protein
VDDDSLFIDPLSRPLVSSGDETDKDTTVDPSLFNVTYARPYIVSLPTSFADGKLTLLAPAAGGDYVGNSNTNLGSISPAAGGDNPGALSPSAGGNSPSKCANAFLDDGWAKPSAPCAE